MPTWNLDASEQHALLERFLRYAKENKDVWFCRRIDIARHWRATFPHV